MKQTTSPKTGNGEALPKIENTNQSKLNTIQMDAAEVFYSKINPAEFVEWIGLSIEPLVEVIEKNISDVETQRAKRALGYFGYINILFVPNLVTFGKNKKETINNYANAIQFLFDEGNDQTKEHLSTIGRAFLTSYEKLDYGDDVAPLFFGVLSNMLLLNDSFYGYNQLERTMYETEVKAAA